MKLTIEESWERMTIWLSEQAPASHMTLNPPATPEQIGDAFTRLSVPVPADLAALLLRHDGAGDSGPNRQAAYFLPSLAQAAVVDGWQRDGWPSPTAMMAEIAEALEHVRDLAAQQHPSVEDGQLTWH